MNHEAPRRTTTPTASMHGVRMSPPRWALWIVPAVLLAAASARFVASGALAYVGVPANVLGLEPLFALLLDGRPINELGARSYGVVAYLLFDPIIRLFGRSSVAVNLWGLGLSLVAVAMAFVLVCKRLNVRRGPGLIALGAAWLGFLPIVYATALRHLDMPVLAFNAATFFFYTGPARRRAWSGVGAAAGFLTKFYPLIFVPFLLVRERVAFLYAIVAIGALLLVGQLAYGTSMGIAYLFVVGGSTAGSIDDFSTWHEGFSLRQLMFKLAAGYRLQPDLHVAAPSGPLLSYLAYAFQIALVVYLLYVVFRHRETGGLERRSIEFALAIVTMYLAAPTIGHEHLVSMVIVYSILAWYWLTRARPSRPVLTLSLVSLFLTGVFLPMPVVGAVLPLDALMRWLGNDGTAIYGNAVGEYDFFGLPGYGVLLAWVVLAHLERSTRGVAATAAEGRGARRPTTQP